MSRGQVAPPRRAAVSPPCGGTRNIGDFTNWKEHSWRYSRPGFLRNFLADDLRAAKKALVDLPEPGILS